MEWKTWALVQIPHLSILVALSFFELQSLIHKMGILRPSPPAAQGGHKDQSKSNEFIRALCKPESTMQM